MRYVSYTLTMPRNSAWNHKWTGESNLYARVRAIRNVSWEKSKDRPLVGKSFYHDFSDGWQACIEVKEVTEKQAKEIKKNSRGFCGYDWMITSLLYKGEIDYDEQLARANCAYF